MNWQLADRTSRMRSSAIREILRSTEQEGMLSMAGGLPSDQSFPVAAIAQATQRVLSRSGGAALQYASSEGLAPLREWLAYRETQNGWPVEPDQVLITTGSQQALDLLGKVLMQPGRHLGVEQPTYLGALQAFQPYGPRLTELSASGLSYLIPNYQNPTGHCMPEAQRWQFVQALQSQAGTVIEDDPYGQLWYDQPPPASLASRLPESVVYLGSMSKVLAPGLRLGYMILPPSGHPQSAALKTKLVQAKQAADLHTSSLSQHIVLQLIEDGFDWQHHLDGVRMRYRTQRDAMARALRAYMPAGWSWQLPQGGMFFWLTGPAHVDTALVLPIAMAHGVAFVPGASFFSAPVTHAPCTMRLSFVTLDEVQINEAVSRLAACLSG